MKTSNEIASEILEAHNILNNAGKIYVDEIIPMLEIALNYKKPIDKKEVDYEGIYYAKFPGDFYDENEDSVKETITDLMKEAVSQAQTEVVFPKFETENRDKELLLIFIIEKIKQANPTVKWKEQN